MDPFVFRFEMLPPDVFIGITELLSSPTLLALSYVNRPLFTELLGRDSDVWKPRLGDAHAPHFTSLKHCFFWISTTRAFQFPGPQVRPRITTGDAARINYRYRGSYGEESPVRVLNDRGGAVFLKDEVNDVFRESSFSLTVRFMLQPAPQDATNAYTGGILFGGQSSMMKDSVWPQFYMQLIHVDPQGNLYASVMDSKKIVASGLKTGRWYHVVLTYAHGYNSQEVFLDGERIDSRRGAFHRERLYITNWQLGTGCISDSAPGKPTPEFSGWYGFRGVIDKASLWKTVLSLGQIKKMVKAKQPFQSTYGAEWSLDDARVSFKPSPGNSNAALRNVKAVRYMRLSKQDTQVFARDA